MPIVFSVMISVLFSLLFSIVVMAARTLGDDVFIVLRRDDVCMKEQSCPGHGYGKPNCHLSTKFDYPELTL